MWERRLPWRGDRFVVRERSEFLRDFIEGPRQILVPFGRGFPYETLVAPRRAPQQGSQRFQVAPSRREPAPPIPVPHHANIERRPGRCLFAHLRLESFHVVALVTDFLAQYLAPNGSDAGPAENIRPVDIVRLAVVTLTRKRDRSRLGDVAYVHQGNARRT